MRIKPDHFNPNMIMESGQCFRWKSKESSADTYEIIHKGHYLLLTDLKDSIELSCSEAEYHDIWADYFDMSTDYNAIEKSIFDFNDAHLIESFRKGNGIRILRQDLWEIIVSFLISQNNNIKRIRNSIDLICQKAALPTIENPQAFRFPLPGEVDSEFFNDKALGLGYRDVYLQDIYSLAKEQPSLITKLPGLNYENACKELLKFNGVGPKVANCICLFGLHHTEAFPIDTHIRQLMDKYYNGYFPYEKFKGTAGIIQQYLFYYEIK